MNVGIEIHPTGPGLACAAAAVAAGAPIFSDGLRARRRRSALAHVGVEPTAEPDAGFVHLHGTVALESPLFAPISNRPCAGYRLEARVAGTTAVASFDQLRRFTLHTGAQTVRVMEHRAHCELSVSAERDLKPADALTEVFSTFIHRHPELAWSRGRGATIHLVERALLAGARCHVVGLARRGRAEDVAPEIAWVRTGTDDEPIEALTMNASASREPDFWVGSGEHLDFLLITDRAPDPRQLTVPAWRVLGTVVGPALSLSGLCYLAGVVDSLRATGNG